MSKVIDVRQAMICCGGSSTTFARNVAGTFQELAQGFLDQARQVRTASGLNPSVVRFVVSAVMKAVKDSEAERFVQFFAGLVGTAGILPQSLEWIPPELQITKESVNDEDGLTLGQITILINVATELELAKHRQRVRNCLVERAFRQDKKAVYQAGSVRTRRPSLGRFGRVKDWAARLVNRLVRKP